MSRLILPRGELNYSVRGAGPCVILCHALGTDSSIWTVMERSLRRSHTVISYDLRGHGQSAPPLDEDYSFGAMADDVRDLLDHLRIGRTSVVGISVGGEVAQMFAARSPDRVSSLLLCSTACVTEPDRAALWQRRIDTVMEQGMGAIAAASVERWFTAPFRERHADLMESFRRRLSALPPQVYVAMARTIRAMDLRPAIRTLSCPTLVVYADQDANTGHAAARTLIENIAGARAIEIPRAAHFPNLEAPGRFNRILQQWLCQNPA